MQCIATWILALTMLAASTSVPARASKAELTVSAFGGLLSGTDQGEWIGSLQFRDASGNTRLLLKKNVLAIVKNNRGIFVFTGLAHLSLNEGQVYRVNRDERGAVRVMLVSNLLGAPSQIADDAKGTTLFLVFSGKFDAQGKQVDECYSLTGDSIRRATGCLRADK